MLNEMGEAALKIQFQHLSVHSRCLFAMSGPSSLPDVLTRKHTELTYQLTLLPTVLPDVFTYQH